MQPVYRLTLKDSAGTVLTPAAGAPHSDPFQVATAQGVTGFEPLLGLPRGRRGRIDPLKGATDTGALSVKILDERTSTGNASRWVTGFVGDGNGQERLGGSTAYLEESTDGGTSWAAYFTGRVQSVRTNGRVWIELEVRDFAEDLKRDLFFNRPSDDLAYVYTPSLYPNALTEPYRNFPTIPKVEGVALDLNWAGLSWDAFDVEHERIDRYREAQAVSSTLRSLAEESLSEGVSKIRLRTSTGHLQLPQAPQVDADSWYAKILNLPRRLVFKTNRDDGGDKFGEGRLDYIGFDEVPASDPKYRTLPTTGTTVEFDVIPWCEARKGAPIVLVDVHPVQLWKDLLEGKFGRLKEDGSPRWSVPFDSAAFTALIADDSFGTGTWWITETAEDAREWLEEHVLQQFGLGWYLNASGEVVPLDLRTPTTTAGLPTLDSSHLRVDAGAPSWTHTREDAITEVRATFYLEGGPGSPEDAGAKAREDTTGLTGIQVLEPKILVADFDDPNLGGDPFTLDATGYRGTTEDMEALRSRLLKRVTELRAPFAIGSMTARVPCRRTATVTGLTQGDLVVLDIDELPNPASNQRGGARLARVVEIVEDGPTVTVSALDMGSTTVATVPVLGTISATTGRGEHFVDVPVTLNAQGEPVALEWAITSTAVGTRPTSGWALARTVKTNSTVEVGPVPSDSRVWIRARSFPIGEGFKLPSAWVYPAANYVDTVAYGAPTGLAVLSGTLTATTARLSWTNASDDLPLEVWIDGIRVEALPAGTTFYFAEFLPALATTEVKVRHVDPWGGEGPFATLNVTTSGSNPSAPPVAGLAVLLGEQV